MSETKRVRIQFSETELLTLLNKLDNVLEEFNENLSNLKEMADGGEEELNLMREYETLNKVHKKLIRSINKLK